MKGTGIFAKFKDSEIILGDYSPRRYRILPKGVLANLACNYCSGSINASLP